MVRQMQSDHILVNYSIAPGFLRYKQLNIYIELGSTLDVEEVLGSPATTLRL